MNVSIDFSYCVVQCISGIFSNNRNLVVDKHSPCQRNGFLRCRKMLALINCQDHRYIGVGESYNYVIFCRTLVVELIALKEVTL